MKTGYTISQLLDLSNVHPAWIPILRASLSTLTDSYLNGLFDDTDWLPGKGRLLAAFRQDPARCRYILFGESPYPRSESANGIAFHDAAVTSLWSERGLSKAVNRATSLRNIIKTALLAENLVTRDELGRVTQTAIADIDKRGLVQNMDELFANLERKGILLLNATPVLHASRTPAVEARFWKPFNAELLNQIRTNLQPVPSLILWGKIAQSITTMEAASSFPHLTSEHPYNLSFIDNPMMQNLFSELKILQSVHQL